MNRAISISHTRARRLIALALIALWLAAALEPARADDTRRRLRVPILMYHYVSEPPEDADRYRRDLSVTPEQLDAQLRWLRDNGYTVVSLDEVTLALRAGAPDNVTCVVADIIEAGPEAGSVPTVVGAAAKRQPPRPPSLGSSAERAAALTAPADPDDESGAARPTAEQRRGRALRRGLGGLLAVVLLAGAGYGGWYWSQRQFYVAPSDGFAAVYRGLSQDLGPVELSRLESVARDVPVRELPTYSRQRVTQGIVAEDRASADQIITTLREQVAACRAARAGHSPETPSPRVGESPTGTKDGTRTPGTTTATTTPTTSPTGTGTAPRTSDPPSPEDCGGIG